MAFTDTEKVKIREYVGYPAYGNAATPNNGYRFFDHYGNLEFKLNDLSAPEEERVREFLVDLDKLKADTRLVQDNMDTSQAAVWYRNKDELAENYQLYYHVRLELVDFLGVQRGPALSRPAYRRVV